MHALYEQFLSYLDKDDRFGCVDLILTMLQKNDLDIVTLYDEVLAPSLRESFCRDKGIRILRRIPLREDGRRVLHRFPSLRAEEVIYVINGGPQNNAAGPR